MIFDRSNIKKQSKLMCFKTADFVIGLIGTYNLEKFTQDRHRDIDSLYLNYCKGTHLYSSRNLKMYFNKLNICLLCNIDSCIIIRGYIWLSKESFSFNLSIFYSVCLWHTNSARFALFLGMRYSLYLCRAILYVHKGFPNSRCQTIVWREN